MAAKKSSSGKKSSAKKKTTKKKGVAATGSKAGTPKKKSGGKKKKSSKASSKKSSSGIRLTHRHRDLLRKVREAGAEGYPAAGPEHRSLSSMHEKRLLIRIANTQATDLHHFNLIHAAEK